MWGTGHPWCVCEECVSRTKEPPTKIFFPVDRVPGIEKLKSWGVTESGDLTFNLSTQVKIKIKGKKIKRGKSLSLCSQFLSLTLLAAAILSSSFPSVVQIINFVFRRRGLPYFWNCLCSNNTKCHAVLMETSFVQTPRNKSNNL